MPDADTPTPTPSDSFNWPLAPLTEWPPQLFVEDEPQHDDLDNLFLAFALVFNDLKSVLLVLSWLGNQKLDEGITPARGQHTGLASQMRRYGVAILHELEQLIRKHKSIIEGPRFTEIRRKHLLKEMRPQWDQLYADAVGNPPASRVLRRVRNDAAFHYWQPRMLANAYRQVFYKDPKDPSNTCAYASVGQSMEATRFYYADAAAERAMTLIAEQLNEPDLDGLILRTLHRANNALVGLLSAFVSHKADALAKKHGIPIPRGPSRKKRKPRR